MNPSEPAGRTLCKVLAARGSHVVFGVPGTQTVPLFEALRTSTLRTVLATSELGATFAALGWARLSRRPGIVTAIPGPGLLVALAALAEARHDSAPLVLLTGTPASGHRFPLQALDQQAVVRPMVKATLRANRASEVAALTASALDLAAAGEPGPVLLELPLEALDDPAHFEIPVPAAPAAALPADVDAVVSRLLAARRPLVFAGLGCAGAGAALLALVERFVMPVATTVSGRGVIPEDHPLALGMDPGTEALGALNRMLDQADLVLALGCKFSHNGTGGYRLRLAAERLVHVDASAESLGGDYRASLAVQADLRAFLPTLLAALPRSEAAASWDPAALQGARAQARETMRAFETRTATDGTELRLVIEALRAVLPRDACVVTDSGLHQLVVRSHFQVLAADGLLVPADFQSMGFGVPAALGAALAQPGRQTVAVVGDGGLAMTGLELLAAVRESVPLKVMVLSDGQLGLIHRQQVDAYGRAHGVDLGPFEPGAVALATGAEYRRLTGDFSAGLADWLALPGPALLEVPLARNAAGRLAAALGVAKSTTRDVLGQRVLDTLRRLRS
ncbi:MAG: thiamine pyrophosphate-binding protein [Gemmatimonadales bacterium]